MFLVGRQLRLGVLIKGIVQCQCGSQLFVNSQDTAELRVAATPPGMDWEKRYFRAPVNQRPTHLHVRALGRSNQRYPLLFRDYLRVHPVASAAYAQIKISLSRQHPDNADLYYEIKDPLCDLVIDAAEDWARTTGWHMGPSDI
jgi:GrpB-like predicted nucleotidyltransferase (UPF0157 family)